MNLESIERYRKIEKLVEFLSIKFGEELTQELKSKGIVEIREIDSVKVDIDIALNPQDNSNDIAIKLSSDNREIYYSAKD